MSELVMEVKPKFYWLQRFVANIRKEIAVTLGLEGLFFMIIVGILIATNNPLVANLAENNQEGFVIYCYIIMMILIVLFLPLSVLLLGVFDKKNFEVTNYKVYDDRINFDEGFINHKHRSILFKDIKEIHLDQNFVQKKYNIGTIRFVTPANDAMDLSGIRFQDIENVQSVYTKVKEIHEINKGD